ncbi:rhodanese-like domain-containing protein [Halovivax sp.]|uniref:rhodanese-like domain-containing protein n=1 Tax=Halovivax sp. TaxID=1935978 RepID=UPI0025BCC6D2|nr:rhodanese-like domain-containing protein [Halovivax sp.]
MNRRQYLAVAGASWVGALAGCLSESGDEAADDDASNDATSGDDDTAGSDDRETLDRFDPAVPLASIDEVVEWHEDDAAIFLDTRSEAQYDESHIAGAKLSPAPDGLAEDDPAEELSTDDRIVTYCPCPHSLSGQRAESLLAAGFESVYVLDEGFPEWVERGYPIEGNEVQGSLTVYEVRGRVDAAHAGEYARLEEPATDQREFGRIDDDGRFELAAQFVDVDAETAVILETPAGSRRGTLGEFTGDEVEV